MSTHDKEALLILCEPGLPEATSHCIGGAGIPGTSETCIQVKYSKDLQFYCSSCTVPCVLHYILILFLQSCSSCFQAPLSPTCFKTLVTGGTFFSLEKQSRQLCVGLFSSASFLEDVLTAVMTCSHYLFCI